VCIPATAWASEQVAEALSEVLSGLDHRRITTGILYDRVLPLSRIDEHDGRAGAGPTTLKHWEQMYHEMFHASLSAPVWPSLRALEADTKQSIRSGVIPIALMNFDFNRIRPDALEDGSLVMRSGRLIETGEGNPFLESRVFAAVALKDYTHRGSQVAFALDGRWYVTNIRRSFQSIKIDFDDGGGFREVHLGEEYSIHYAHTGRKIIRVRVGFAGGETLEGGSYFRVASLQVPLPHDTLVITAAIPYNGEFGTGEAYVYRSDANSALTLPAILVEGFDIGNTMNWDELYELANQQGLMDTLRAWGYDAVILNFTSGTDYIQKNAFALVELIEQIKAQIAPGTDMALVGASMGGLVSRYALSYMETNALDHRVRLFISFDSPQNGANIPLGLQYWVAFFSGQSTEAADLLAALDSPAARQMLVYHHTDPPGTTGEPNPLRADLEADLETLGGYPANLRKVAVANGSGSQADQGFAPGDQIIFYEYSSFLVDIIGNCWAVSAGAIQQIFDGVIDIILLPREEMQVSVTGTMPYDNATGGYRGSMAQMDSTEAPYGDIVALHDNHCFIPTISALDLAISDPFYDINGDPNILGISPFDALYVRTVNEGHVEITEESVLWFLGEIGPGPSAVAPGPVFARGLELFQNTPNPFNPVTTIRFAVPARTHVELTVYDFEGRLVRRLRDRSYELGSHLVEWDGRDDRGTHVSSGVYLYRLKTGHETRTRKMVLLK
jgi:hypothetical protein